MIDIPPVAGQHDIQVWQRPHLLPGQPLQQVLIKVGQLEQRNCALLGALSSHDTQMRAQGGGGGRGRARAAAWKIVLASPQAVMLWIASAGAKLVSWRGQRGDAGAARERHMGIEQEN